MFERVGQSTVVVLQNQAVDSVVPEEHVVETFLILGTHLVVENGVHARVNAREQEAKRPDDMKDVTVAS